MQKFRNFKDSLSKATESLSKAAAEAGNKLKDIDIENTISQTTNTILKAKDDVQDLAKNFDADKAKGQIIKMASDGKEALIKHFAEAKQTDAKVMDIINNSKEDDQKMHVEDALKLIYLVMVADGEITKNEQDKFALITEDFKGYGETLDNIDNYCMSVNNIAKTENYANDLLQRVIDVMAHFKLNHDGNVDKKVLLWNLLAVAYSDGEYTKTEKDLIYIINRSLEIDESLVQDMESSISTMLAIEKEREYLTNTNRQYLKIQEKIKTLDERREIIMESVRELLEI